MRTGLLPFYTCSTSDSATGQFSATLLAYFWGARWTGVHIELRLSSLVSRCISSRTNQCGRVEDVRPASSSTNLYRFKAAVRSLSNAVIAASFFTSCGNSLFSPCFRKQTIK